MKIFATLWLFVCIATFGVLVDYENRPGEPADPPARWPGDPSFLLGGKGAFTMVMFLHPKCSCSQASLEELNRLLVKQSLNLKTLVLFYQPSTRSSTWTESSLFKVASTLPVEIQRDKGGRLGEKFGVTTSGHIVLYDSNGDLVFSGGITGSRGHSGDNAGKSSLEALLAGNSPETRTTHTFGCSLGHG